MKKTRNRVISLTLALVMLLSMVPAYAITAESEPGTAGAEEILAEEILEQTDDLESSSETPAPDAADPDAAAPDAADPDAAAPDAADPDAADPDVAAPDAADPDAADPDVAAPGDPEEEIPEYGGKNPHKEGDASLLDDEGEGEPEPLYETPIPVAKEDQGTIKLDANGLLSGSIYLKGLFANNEEVVVAVMPNFPYLFGDENSPMGKPADGFLAGGSLNSYFEHATAANLASITKLPFLAYTGKTPAAGSQAGGFNLIFSGAGSDSAKDTTMTQIDVGAQSKIGLTQTKVETWFGQNSNYKHEQTNGFSYTVIIAFSANDFYYFDILVKDYIEYTVALEKPVDSISGAQITGTDLYKAGGEFYATLHNSVTVEAGEAVALEGPDGTHNYTLIGWQKDGNGAFYSDASCTTPVEDSGGNNIYEVLPGSTTYFLPADNTATVWPVLKEKRAELVLVDPDTSVEIAEIVTTFPGVNFDITEFKIRNDGDAEAVIRSIKFNAPLTKITTTYAGNAIPALGVKFEEGETTTSDNFKVRYTTPLTEVQGGYGGYLLIEYTEVGGRIGSQVLSIPVTLIDESAFLTVRETNETDSSVVSLLDLGTVKQSNTTSKTVYFHADKGKNIYLTAQALQELNDEFSAISIAFNSANLEEPAPAENEVDDMYDDDPELGEVYYAVGEGKYYYLISAGEHMEVTVFSEAKSVKGDYSDTAKVNYLFFDEEQEALVEDYNINFTTVFSVVENVDPEVTIRLTANGSTGWQGQTVALKPTTGAGEDIAVPHSSTGNYAVQAPAGTYKILVNGVDTGKTVTVVDESTAPAPVTLPFFSVTAALSGADVGTNGGTLSNDSIAVSNGSNFAPSSSTDPVAYLLEGKGDVAITFPAAKTGYTRTVNATGNITGAFSDGSYLNVWATTSSSDLTQAATVTAVYTGNKYDVTVNDPTNKAFVGTGSADPTTVNHGESTTLTAAPVYNGGKDGSNPTSYYNSYLATGWDVSGTAGTLTAGIYPAWTLSNITSAVTATPKFAGISAVTTDTGTTNVTGLSWSPIQHDDNTGEAGVVRKDFYLKNFGTETTGNLSCAIVQDMNGTPFAEGGTPFGLHAETALSSTLTAGAFTRGAVTYTSKNEATGVFTAYLQIIDSSNSANPLYIPLTATVKEPVSFTPEIKVEIDGVAMTQSSNDVVVTLVKGSDTYATKWVDDHFESADPLLYASDGTYEVKVNGHSFSPAVTVKYTEPDVEVDIYKTSFAAVTGGAPKITAGATSGGAGTALNVAYTPVGAVLTVAANPAVGYEFNTTTGWTAVGSGTFGSVAEASTTYTVAAGAATDNVLTPAYSQKSWTWTPTDTAGTIPYKSATGTAVAELATLAGTLPDSLSTGYKIVYSIKGDTSGDGDEFFALNAAGTGLQVAENSASLSWASHRPSDTANKTIAVIVVANVVTSAGGATGYVAQEEEFTITVTPGVLTVPKNEGATAYTYEGSTKEGMPVTIADLKVGTSKVAVVVSNGINETDPKSGTFKGAWDEKTIKVGANSYFLTYAPGDDAFADGDTAADYLPVNTGNFTITGTVSQYNVAISKTDNTTPTVAGNYKETLSSAIDFGGIVIFNQSDSVIYTKVSSVSATFQPMGEAEAKPLGNTEKALLFPIPGGSKNLAQPYSVTKHTGYDDAEQASIAMKSAAASADLTALQNLAPGRYTGTLTFAVAKTTAPLLGAGHNDTHADFLNTQTLTFTYDVLPAKLDTLKLHVTDLPTAGTATSNATNYLELYGVDLGETEHTDGTKNYTISTPTWEAAGVADSKFKYNVRPTVSFTITAKDGYYFDRDDGVTLPSGDSTATAEFGRNTSNSNEIIYTNKGIDYKITLGDDNVTPGTGTAYPGTGTGDTALGYTQLKVTITFNPTAPVIETIKMSQIATAPIDTAAKHSYDRFTMHEIELETTTLYGGADKKFTYDYAVWEADETLPTGDNWDDYAPAAATTGFVAKDTVGDKSVSSNVKLATDLTIGLNGSDWDLLEAGKEYTVYVRLSYTDQTGTPHISAIKSVNVTTAKALDLSAGELLKSGTDLPYVATSSDHGVNFNASDNNTTDSGTHVMRGRVLTSPTALTATPATGYAPQLVATQGSGSSYTYAIWHSAETDGDISGNSLATTENHTVASIVFAKKMLGEITVGAPTLGGDLVVDVSGITIGGAAPTAADWTSIIGGTAGSTIAVTYKDAQNADVAVDLVDAGGDGVPDITYDTSDGKKLLMIPIAASNTGVVGKKLTVTISYCDPYAFELFNAESTLGTDHLVTTGATKETAALTGALPAPTVELATVENETTVTGDNGGLQVTLTEPADASNITQYEIKIYDSTGTTPVYTVPTKVTSTANDAEHVVLLPSRTTVSGGGVSLLMPGTSYVAKAEAINASTSWSNTTAASAAAAAGKVLPALTDMTATGSATWAYTYGGTNPVSVGWSGATQTLFGANLTDTITVYYATSGAEASTAGTTAPTNAGSYDVYVSVTSGKSFVALAQSAATKIGTLTISPKVVSAINLTGITVPATGTALTTKDDITVTLGTSGATGEIYDTNGVDWKYVHKTDSTDPGETLISQSGGAQPGAAYTLTATVVLADADKVNYVFAAENALTVTVNGQTADANVPNSPAGAAQVIYTFPYTAPTVTAVEAAATAYNKITLNTVTVTSEMPITKVEWLVVAKDATVGSSAVWKEAALGTQTVTGGTGGTPYSRTIALADAVWTDLAPNMAYDVYVRAYVDNTTVKSADFKLGTPVVTPFKVTVTHDVPASYGYLSLVGEDGTTAIANGAPLSATPSGASGSETLANVIQLKYGSHFTQSNAWTTITGKGLDLSDFFKTLPRATVTGGTTGTTAGVWGGYTEKPDDITTHKENFTISGLPAAGEGNGTIEVKFELNPVVVLKFSANDSWGEKTGAEDKITSLDGGTTLGDTMILGYLDTPLALPAVADVVIAPEGPPKEGYTATGWSFAEGDNSANSSSVVKEATGESVADFLKNNDLEDTVGVVIPGDINMSNLTVAETKILHLIWKSEFFSFKAQEEPVLQAEYNMTRDQMVTEAAAQTAQTGAQTDTPIKYEFDLIDAMTLNADIAAAHENNTARIEFTIVNKDVYVPNTTTPISSWFEVVDNGELKPMLTFKGTAPFDYVGDITLQIKASDGTNATSYNMTVHFAPQTPAIAWNVVNSELDHYFEGEEVVSKVTATVKDLWTGEVIHNPAATPDAINGGAWTAARHVDSTAVVNFRNLTTEEKAEAGDPPFISDKFDFTFAPNAANVKNYTTASYKGGVGDPGVEMKWTVRDPDVRFSDVTVPAEATKSVHQVTHLYVSHPYGTNKAVIFSDPSDPTGSAITSPEAFAVTMNNLGASTVTKVTGKVTMADTSEAGTFAGFASVGATGTDIEYAALFDTTGKTVDISASGFESGKTQVFKLDLATLSGVGNSPMAFTSGDTFTMKFELTAEETTGTSTTSTYTIILEVLPVEVEEVELVNLHAPVETETPANYSGAVEHAEGTSSITVGSKKVYAIGAAEALSPSGSGTSNKQYTGQVKYVVSATGAGENSDFGPDSYTAIITLTPTAGYSLPDPSTDAGRALYTLTLGDEDKTTVTLNLATGTALADNTGDIKKNDDGTVTIRYRFPAAAPKLVVTAIPLSYHELRLMQVLGSGGNDLAQNTDVRFIVTKGVTNFADVDGEDFWKYAASPSASTAPTGITHNDDNLLGGNKTSNIEFGTTGAIVEGSTAATVSIADAKLPSGAEVYIHVVGRQGNEGSYEYSAVASEKVTLYYKNYVQVAGMTETEAAAALASITYTYPTFKEVVEHNGSPENTVLYPPAIFTTTAADDTNAISLKQFVKVAANQGTEGDGLRDTVVAFKNDGTNYGDRFGVYKWTYGASSPAPTLDDTLKAKSETYSYALGQTVNGSLLVFANNATLTAHTYKKLTGTPVIDSDDTAEAIKQGVVLTATVAETGSDLRLGNDLLTALPTTNDNAKYSYQWYYGEDNTATDPTDTAKWTAISGAADNAYTVTDATDHIGKYFAVLVTYTEDTATADTKAATSTSTFAVANRVNGSKLAAPTIVEVDSSKWNDPMNAEGGVTVVFTPSADESDPAFDGYEIVLKNTSDVTVATFEGTLTKNNDGDYVVTFPALDENGALLTKHDFENNFTVSIVAKAKTDQTLKEDSPAATATGTLFEGTIESIIYTDKQGGTADLLDSAHEESTYTFAEDGEATFTAGYLGLDEDSFTLTPAKGELKIWYLSSTGTEGQDETEDLPVNVDTYRVYVSVDTTLASNFKAIPKTLVGTYEITQSKPAFNAGTAGAASGSFLTEDLPANKRLNVFAEIFGTSSVLTWSGRTEGTVTVLPEANRSWYLDAALAANYTFSVAVTAEDASGAALTAGSDYVAAPITNATNLDGLKAYEIKQAGTYTFTITAPNYSTTAGGADTTYKANMDLPDALTFTLTVTDKEVEGITLEKNTAVDKAGDSTTIVLTYGDSVDAVTGNRGYFDAAQTAANAANNATVVPLDGLMVSATYANGAAAEEGHVISSLATDNATANKNLPTGVEWFVALNSDGTGDATAIAEEANDLLTFKKAGTVYLFAVNADESLQSEAITVTLNPATLDYKPAETSRDYKGSNDKTLNSNGLTIDSGIVKPDGASDDTVTLTTTDINKLFELTSGNAGTVTANPKASPDTSTITIGGTEGGFYTIGDGVAAGYTINKLKLAITLTDILSPRDESRVYADGILTNASGDQQKTAYALIKDDADTKAFSDTTGAGAVGTYTGTILAGDKVWITFQTTYETPHTASDQAPVMLIDYIGGDTFFALSSKDQSGNYELDTTVNGGKIDNELGNKDNVPAEGGVGNRSDVYMREIGKITAVVDPGTGGGDIGGGSSSYTVTYDAMDLGALNKAGKQTETEKVKEGESPAKTPEIIVNDPDSYVFLHWTTTKPTAQAPVPAAADPAKHMVDGDVTFYAAYAAIGTHTAYIKGTTDGTFAPGANITRAEVATIIARACFDDFDEENGEYWSETDIRYSDVAGNWAERAIAYVTMKGIFNGRDTGEFEPSQNITRQEFALVIARMDGLLAMGDDAQLLERFSDIGQTAEWALDGMYTAVKNGWVQGYTDGTVKPLANIHRDEAVKVFNAYLKRGVDEIGLGDLDYKAWPDMSETHWAYYEVAEASNDHTYYYRDGVKPAEQWITAEYEDYSEED